MEDNSTFSHGWCNVLLEGYIAPNITNFKDPSDMNTIRALVFSVVLMMLLGFTLLCTGFVHLFLGRHNLNLSIGRYNLYPVLRVLLRVTFVLFLPLLSTALSLTKEQNQGGGGTNTGLLLVLLWMLLIELIRKKVQVLVLPTDGSSFSRGTGRFTLMDYSDELAHVMWTGYLVYTNIQQVDHPTMKAIFTILWSLSLFKVGQRAANTYVASHSFATAMNPLLIDVYMRHAFGRGHGTSRAPANANADAIASEHMEMCNFVVEGESKLLPKKKKKKKVQQQQQPAQPTLVTIPSYDSTLGGRPGHLGNEKQAGLDIDPANIADAKFVTVNKVWEWGQEDHHNAKLFALKTRRGEELVNMCISFSLFKLLRRRFEKYPMVEVGCPMVRRLMLRGLLNLSKPMEVLQLELAFLENYYQAAQNVVMSQPILFISNFALSMLFVPIYLVAVVAILLFDKDAIFLYCTARGWSNVDDNPLLIVFLSITLALLGTLVCVEASEFITSYFFSNWNTVRLACSYGSLPQSRRLLRWVLYYLIAFRFLVSTVLRSVVKFVFRQRTEANTRIKINQVSIVNACGPLDKLISAWTYQVTLETKAKQDIIKTLQGINEETGTISHPTAHGLFANVLDGTPSVTEIILSAHLATELFHINQEKQQGGKSEASVAATTLSRYCMYLVALLPGLLPDDETWVSQKLEGMRNCLTKVLQQCDGCTMCTPNRPCKHRMAESLSNDAVGDLDGPTKNALKLRGKINNWDDLATFWVNLLIYLAPSNDIQGHAKAIASTGGDLITYLWTFCTHAGITRELTTTADHAV